MYTKNDTGVLARRKWLCQRDLEEYRIQLKRVDRLGSSSTDGNAHSWWTCKTKLSSVALALCQPKNVSVSGNGGCGSGGAVLFFDDGSFVLLVEWPQVTWPGHMTSIDNHILESSESPFSSATKQSHHENRIRRKMDGDAGYVVHAIFTGKRLRRCTILFVDCWPWACVRRTPRKSSK